MSRSFAKKYRLCKTDTRAKRRANKRIRQMKDFDVSGRAFRKLYNSWDINDSGLARVIPYSGEDWTRSARRK